MSNIVISVGNSDNKLTQIDWSDFVGELRNAIERLDCKVHFFGGSPTWEQWQNVAWILQVQDGFEDDLMREVVNIRRKYKQDSAFVLSGYGTFV